jgi:DNA mismatch repair protein MutL
MLALDAEPAQEADAADHSAVQVSGFVGVPALHRAGRNYISLFVNRRWIQDRALSHAVIQAYHTLLPAGRYPMAVVLLTMDPALVDVNVHPTKRECRFRDARRVFSSVERTVRRTLVERAPVPMLSPAARHWPAVDWEGNPGLLRTGEGERPLGQMPMELVHPAYSGRELDPVGPVRLPLLRVVGQIGQTYVVAEGPQGMYLIDQHAAHERVLYEQMLAAYKGHSQPMPSQSLLEPLVLDLDPLLGGAMDEHMATLNEVGFDLKPFGGTSYLLRAVPSVLAVPDVRGALLDILDALRQDDDPLAAQANDRLIAAVCKRAAIKAGRTLSFDEMQQLVRQLELCESPRTCPHGRPTVLHFSAEQLERQFGRR